MLVSDKNRPQSDPGGSLDDYASWRRVAVAVRRSVLAQNPPGALPWLEEWTDSDSPLDTGRASTLADPTPKQVADLKYPRLPKDVGVVLAMGAARVFTDKIPSLVAYAVEGDSMIAVPTDAQHAAARERKVKETRLDTTGDPLWWIKPTVFGALGALVLGGIGWAVYRFRRRSPE